jgi:hypothetical protein
VGHYKEKIHHTARTEFLLCGHTKPPRKREIERERTQDSQFESYIDEYPQFSRWWRRNTQLVILDKLM